VVVTTIDNSSVRKKERHGMKHLMKHNRKHNRVSANSTYPTETATPSHTCNPQQKYISPTQRLHLFSSPIVPSRTAAHPSFIHLFSYSFIHHFIHSLIHSFILYFIYLFIHPLLHLIYLFILYVIHLFTLSFIIVYFIALQVGIGNLELL